MKTSREIAAARIVAQGLTAAPRRSPLEVVRQLLSVQGQVLPGALTSVALRTQTGDLDPVREAMNRGDLVRSWTQRGTIHLLSAQDLGWILALTGQRQLKAGTRNRENLGITSAMIDLAAGSLLGHIEQHGPISRAGITELWQPLGINDVPGRNYRLVVTLMVKQLIVYGPLAEGSSSDQLITASETWLPESAWLDYDDAVARLVVRYFTGHGPATLEDLTRWIGLPKTHLRKGIAEAGEALAAFDFDGETYYHDPTLPDLVTEAAGIESVMLLPGFDELILGYKDRSMTLAPENEIHVVPGRNGVFRHTVIRGCRARGTWKPSSKKTGPPIEITPFPGETIDTDAAHAVAEGHPLVTR